jgi:hypothetical protein
MLSTPLGSTPSSPPIRLHLRQETKGDENVLEPLERPHSYFSTISPDTDFNVQGQSARPHPGINTWACKGGCA